MAVLLAVAQYVAGLFGGVSYRCLFCFASLVQFDWLSLHSSLYLVGCLTSADSLVSLLYIYFIGCFTVMLIRWLTHCPVI